MNWLIILLVLVTADVLVSVSRVHLGNNRLTVVRMVGRSSVGLVSVSGVTNWLTIL